MLEAFEYLRRRNVAMLRRRKGSDWDKASNGEVSENRKEIDNSNGKEEGRGHGKRDEEKKRQVEEERRRNKKRWSCVDSCCWLIGFVCSFWWFLLFMFNAMPASFPQYVTEAITGPLPDPPGVKLRKEGLKVKHPVVFVPGIVTGGLELWEGHQCADGLFRKRLWGGTFGELYKRYVVLCTSRNFLEGGSNQPDIILFPSV